LFLEREEVERNEMKMGVAK